ncbi:MAG: hypothetical protein SFX19_05990 [Alphaproteobacteria bacterium]|nr:hypothetical protein [Alphaproteobacteria bacterium]
MEPRNKGNVQDRIHNTVSVETFLEKSMATKTEYGTRLVERMNHMGLGEGYENIFRKWKYINRTSQTDALLKGATVTGIVAAVMLTIADSKPLLKLLGMESKDQEPMR